MTVNTHTGSVLYSRWDRGDVYNKSIRVQVRAEHGAPGKLHNEKSHATGKFPNVRQLPTGNRKLPPHRHK